MGSVLTSHLRATYGAAVKECVEMACRTRTSYKPGFMNLRIRNSQPKYAENQTGMRECHDSAETLTANWKTLQSHMTSWNELTGVNIATHGLCLFRACQLIAHLQLNQYAKNTNLSLGRCQSCFSNFESVPQDRSMTGTTVWVDLWARFLP